MIGLLATILVLLALALVLRASSYRHSPSHDPVVIDLAALRSYEEKMRANLPVPVATYALPSGPEASSPFDQGVSHQLPTGPPPRPGGRPRPAGGLPSPDPPRPVGALLEATLGPPTYGACGCDAYAD